MLLFDFVDHYQLVVALDPSFDLEKVDRIVYSLDEFQGGNVDGRGNDNDPDLEIVPVNLNLVWFVFSLKPKRFD